MNLKTRKEQQLQKRKRKLVNNSNDKIANIYFNPERVASFGGRQKLTKALRGKISKNVINDWLQSTDSYTLHKDAKRKFPRRKYIVTGINHLWQMDLAIFSQFAKFNDGYKYILVVIDVFSKKAYASPLKTKSGLEVSIAIDKIISKYGNNEVLYCQTDKGTEFTNKFVQSVFKKHDIHHYTYTNEEIKASFVERFQRTLKQRLYRYFTHSNNYRYIDVLQKMITSYNNTEHSSHKEAPNNVSSSNQEEIWQNMYNPDKPLTISKPKFKIGDAVRISKYSTVFAKGYLPSWSNEIFNISKVHKTTPVVYSLRDEAGDELIGTWYAQELQKVALKNNVYKIESILGQRKVNGKIQYLVRWLGYPSSYDSYIDKSQLIQNYKN